MTPIEKMNAIRFNGQSQFYETWFIKIQHEEQGILWLRFTLVQSKGEFRTATWITWVDRNKRLTQSLRNNANTFSRKGNTSFSIGDSNFSPEHVFGKIVTDDEAAEFDLHFSPSLCDISPLPKLFYYISPPHTKFQIPSARCRVSGKALFREYGLALEMEDSKAYQAHFWGTEQVPFYIWASATSFERQVSVEVISSRVPLAIPTPRQTVVVIKYKNRSYHANGLLRSIWNKATHSNENFIVRCSAGNHMFELAVFAKVEETISVKYDYPGRYSPDTHVNFFAYATLKIEGPELNETIPLSDNGILEIAQQDWFETGFKI